MFSQPCLRWTCALALLVPMVAHAQTARFSGQITDPQAAVVSGADVRALNKDSGERFEGRTDSSGSYAIPYLIAGHYQIEVRAKGFNTALSNDITIGVGQVFVYNVQLTVGGASATVNVNAGNEASQIQTQNAEVTGTITGKEVTGLQLNGRNFSQLIALAPGVSNQTGQDEARVGMAGSVSYSVNGGRTEYNSFQVDGSETLNVGINKDHTSLIVTPSIDAIQEIKVLTSNYGAMYPSTGNGTTIVTTKSGSDTYHAVLYEFLRNELFNAKGYFDVTNGAPLYRRNDFGGTIGGPLSIPHVYDARRRTHFFFSEEARLEKDPYAFRQGVPSLAERNGDFSDVCPASADANFGVSRTQYPDCPTQGLTGYGYPLEVSRQALVNRNAQAILNTGIIPGPTATMGCNSSIGSCYNAEVSLPTYWREELFRIDHTISDRMQASFRYIHDEWDETTPVPPYAILTNSFPTIQSRFYGPGTSLAVRFTDTISSTLINEFVVSYTNSYLTLSNVAGNDVNTARPAALDQPCSFDSSGESQCPIGSIFQNGYGGKMPGIYIAGNNAAYGGYGFGVDSGYLPWEHSNPIINISDNLVKILGRHNLQFGAQWILYNRNQTNGPIGAATGDVQGLLTFSNTKGSNSTGNAFADFLYHADQTQTNNPNPADEVSADAIASFQQDSAQARYHQRYVAVEPYFQDDFKVTKRLTLNLGLRLSLFEPFREVQGNAYNWVQSAYSSAVAASLSVDPSSGYLTDRTTGTFLTINPANPSAGLDSRILNGIVRCGSNGVPSGCMTGHLFNPAPRIGAAWDPEGNGKLAIRAGYGIFFEHGTADEANTGSLEGSSPLVLDMTALNPLNWNNIDSAHAAFPLNVTSIPTKAVWPYVQQWSLSVERQVTPTTSATVAYVGSKGTHLTTELQLNQLKPLAAAQNPFGLHQPLLTRGPNPYDPDVSATTYAGDCDAASLAQAQSSPGGGYLEDGTFLSSGTAAYTNFQAACYGVPGAGVIAVPNFLREAAPGLGEIYSLQNIANSSYNSFQATLRRTSGRLTLGVAYTYSHSLDDASDRSDATFVNSFDLQANRASSNFDQRHLLHISYIYDFPLRQWIQAIRSTINRTSAQPLTSNVGKILADGWQLSGLTRFETGIPFTVVNGGSAVGISSIDNAGVANGIGSGSYPDVSGISVHSAKPAGGTTGNSFGPLLLNPEAFVAPRGLTFGNAGRNSLNDPDIWNWDAALLKTFALPGQASSLQFRAEAFNVFNNTQFRIYDPVLGNQANNTVSCYGGYASGYSAGGGAGTDCLTGNSFLHPVDAHRPRTVQFGLKLSF